MIEIQWYRTFREVLDWETRETEVEDMRGTSVIGVTGGMTRNDKELIRCRRVESQQGDGPFKIRGTKYGSEGNLETSLQ